MRSVGFTFQPDVSAERQDSILDEINRWDEINSAKRLKPDAQKEDLLRMAYAYLNEHAVSSEIIRRLAELSEIDPESISTPTERHLAQ
jgi:hypothetical protein